MKILVVGSGAREHVLSYKLAEDKRVSKIYVAPGNAGTLLEEKCENINIKYNDIASLLAFALDKKVDLAVIGPEEPLSLGIVDTFTENGIKTFGPKKAGAMIEASKSFAKEVMKAANIPTALYEYFTDFNKALDYIKTQNFPTVIKADGLAAGKGVTVATDMAMAEAALRDIFLNHAFGDKNVSVVVEEFMAGEEATYLAITDGKNIVPFLPSQDHKQIFDGDKGANTGGMGAYAPAPILNKERTDFVTERISKPLIKELSKRGIEYRGVIYAGLMINGDSIKVVEFNSRFGDPECEVILPLVKNKENNSLLDLMLESAAGDISKLEIEMEEKAATCVVLASKGYPGKYEQGFEIMGIDEANKLDNIKVFHAGTKVENGKVLTSGGRVLTVVGMGNSLEASTKRAYEAVSKISFNGSYHRTDIAFKAFKK